MTKQAKELPVQRALRSFQEFTRAEASGGVLLLLCAVLALVWANSRWADAYVAAWQTEVTIGFGRFVLSKPLLLWINDGLMAIFFFVVGLEIKREVLFGELASGKQAALPAIAALGGMIVPAIIYIALNAGSPGARGWGIPMATDIAFAIGILALLGNRVPTALKVFLVALAIADDIGAVLVIALFYTAEIAWPALAIGGGFLACLVIANMSGVRRAVVYALLGTGLWLAFLRSGVHATVAGVLVAMTIPSRYRINTGELIAEGRGLLDRIERVGDSSEGALTDEEQTAVRALETACERVQTPLQRLESGLHRWVALAIMPLFALANAGVVLGSGLALTSRISWGVIAGLVLGKQIGITGFAWLAVRTGLASIPRGTTWLQIYGAGCLGGIGFTMSLFIAGLAFNNSEDLTAAKLGILIASILAGLVGWLLLRLLPTRAETDN
jgi:NhaA family Na+:H+ antiporter